MDPVVLLLITASGLATVLGAVPLVAIRSLSHRTHDVLLGFTGGLMTAVVVLGLLPHAIEHSTADLPTLAGSVLAGVLLILVLAKAVRRLPLPMAFGGPTESGGPRVAFLLFLALAIHNFPEGLATGVGYGEGLTAAGNGIALAIALQNIPEGFLVAIAVLKETGSRRTAAGYALASGLVEPVAGTIGYAWLSVSPAHLALASGIAAGAMLAAVAFQILPESHRHGYHVPATVTFILGIGLTFLTWLALGAVSP